MSRTIRVSDKLYDRLVKVKWVPDGNKRDTFSNVVERLLDEYDQICIYDEESK